MNVRIVYGDTCHWVDWRFPGAPLEHAHGIAITRLPACMDSSTGKIDVAQMIFVIEAWRFKSHDVHECAAAIAGHFLDLRCFTLRIRHQANKFAHDMAKLMDMFLARNMTVGAAGKLDILLTIKNLPD